MPSSPRKICHGKRRQKPFERIAALRHIYASVAKVIAPRQRGEHRFHAEKISRADRLMSCHGSAQGYIGVNRRRLT